MFVTQGACARLVERRKADFAAEFIRPLIIEAEKLGIDIDMTGTNLGADSTEQEVAA